MSNKRIQLFTGAYGSGKTEVSMNYAENLRKNYDKVALVDLDIANPYFRSREAAGPLEEAGIEVIPKGRLANADLPALSPEILRVLQDTSYQAVFDVGGDDVGAIALGRFNPYFKEGEYDMNFVINTLRPFTQNPEGIMGIMEEVMHAARLKITHLVVNINLCGETNVEDIKAGYQIVKEVSEKRGLPIRYIAVEESLKEDINLEDFVEPIQYIHLYNRPTWMN